MEGNGLLAEGEFFFFAFIWLVSRTTGESRVSYCGRFGMLDFILDGYFRVQIYELRSDFNLNVPQSSLSPW